MQRMQTHGRDEFGSNCQCWITGCAACAVLSVLCCWHRSTWTHLLLWV